MPLDLSSDEFLLQHLKMWKDLGIPAPLNELQSIEAWLQHLGRYGLEETKRVMRVRMVLLMSAANALHSKGPEAEDIIYADRPDMRPQINKEGK
jgi:hypothetical protein